MSITVNLKPSVLSRLEELSRELSVNTDTIIGKALEDYFYFQKLNSLRKDLKGHAQQVGFENDEDVFEAVS